MGDARENVVDREECSICGNEVVGQVWSCVHTSVMGARVQERTPTVIRRYVALDAAVAAIIERYCDTSRGILCSDFRQAADFLHEEFAPAEETREQQ